MKELIKQLRNGQTYCTSSGNLLDMSSIMDDAAEALEQLTNGDCEGWNAPEDTIKALRTRVAELEAAAKLAWIAIIELRYSNSTDKARSVSEFAVEALRKAGVK